MSEKQLMKAEELLDLIASPGSRSQKDASSEDKNEGGSNDSSYACVEEISSKEPVSIVSYPCESEAVSSESDIIASHAFLEEPDTYYCNSASDLDSHTAISESDLTGNCNADIHTGSGVGQEPNTKYDGNTDENLEFSKMNTGVKTAGLDSEFDATKIQGSEIFESELKPRAEESDTKSNMDVSLFEMEEEHKILETESSYNGCGMETSEGLFKQRVNEPQAELQIYSQTGMEVEVHIDEVNQTQKETETEYFTDDTKSEGKYGELSPESGSHAVGMKTSIASQNVQLNQEEVPQGSAFEDVNLELKSCKEELELTKKLLARSERQLEKANSYNEDLRRQAETLSAEIHHYRHRTMVDVGIQVDKDELINYASGEMVLPDWGTTFQSSTRSAEAETDDTSAQAVSTEKLSIAESLKATAEAVVLEQSGFVYDQNSGLYYDYNSGYYYDNEKSLYYDPNSGTYFHYDHETNEYQFHSQVDVTCYQWQHQSGASDGQPGAAGNTTQTVQSMAGQAALASSQQKIVSKENLRKTEKRRKKEKKKEKEKDEKVMNEGVEEIVSSFEDMKITRKHALELAGGWPPCIRVMVTESCCLEVGTLFIVTCTGGTVGREKDMNHTIRIPDINVSKMHAEIKYDSRRGQYEIFDRGSQNGTYINDLRIAEGKDSKTCSPIRHGDVLQLGDNKLLCHIHTGSDTCDKCEPGIVKANYFANQPKERITILSKEEKKLQQKQQLKEIKKKYGLKNAAYVDNTKAINNPQYTDKASERRKTVGSDGPEVKKQTPASVHRPISSENIGHKLLKKMGWSEGESLGKENTGIQEPVTVTLRANQTAGLGSSSSALFSPDDANSIDVRKAARRVQAQQRFSKLQSDTAGNQTDKSKTTKQWTKGETQYAEGGNS